MTFWCESGSALLTNGSGSGSNSFLQKLKGCKKFVSYFLLITYPQEHYLQSIKFDFLLKIFFVSTFYFARHYFSPRQHFHEKREGSGARSVPLTNGSASGRPKTSVADPDPDPHVLGPPGSGSGSGSFYHHAKIVRKTLILTIL